MRGLGMLLAVLLAAGDSKAALAAHQRATQTHPQSCAGHAGLGGMQLLELRYADAAQSLQRAISLGDHGSRSLIGMGMAYLHCGPAACRPRGAGRGEGARHTEDPADVDRLIAWIDARSRAGVGDPEQPLPFTPLVQRSAERPAATQAFRKCSR